MTVTLEDGSYLEATDIANEGVYDLMLALAEAGADGRTIDELAAALAARGDDDGERAGRRLSSPAATRSRITKTNVQLGFKLIEAVDRARDELSAYRISPTTTLLFRRQSASS